MFVLILLGLVGIVLVLAWSIGLGWLLTHILPFSLFEGSLLSMAASVIVGYIATRMMGSMDLPFAESDTIDDDIGLSAYSIPATRFYQTSADQTWEAWFRFELANRLDDALVEAPQVTGRMDKTQRQELAIRLADIAIPLLKAKTGKTKHIRTQLSNWRQHMTKQGLKPYDDNILRLAMTTVNQTISQQMFDNVIRAKLWDKSAAMFDLVQPPLP